jgi:capsular exopolysaccharide synthesis family protein
MLDTTLKSQQDVENILSIPFLGLLPLIDTPMTKTKDRAARAAQVLARDLYVLQHPKSSSAECARFIRTNLMFMSPDHPLRALAVTSPAPQEGKTTTAVSLAVTMARAGTRVLLVDTDMRRPRLHRVFGLPNDIGISSVIVGEATLDQAIAKTEVPSLDVLVCGPLPPTPSEILHTERFRTVLRELKERYDLLLFDTPPVGPVADPVVLGAQIDGVLLILKCERTTRDLAKQAMRALRDANVRVLGAVLNDVDIQEKRYSRVYYAYYRRYGTYYGDRDKLLAPGADAKGKGRAA